MVLCGVLLLFGCGGDGNGAGGDMRISGSGASFPFPLYSNWFKSYSRAHENLIVDYQAKGSGAGVRDFINRTVDFAASDAAMTVAEREQVEGGVVMLPPTAGEVVLAYNLPQVDQRLRLPRDVYPDIFLGEITRWDDPRIAAANPDADLPDLPITLVRRADSSGTTNAFTRHLTAVSEAWDAGPGYGKTVQWPEDGRWVAAPKNDGVTATIRQTPGAIGYIEAAFAKFAEVPTAVLENQAGNFVPPGAEGGRAALASVEMPENLVVWIDDPPGDDAYPSVTYTWLLFYRDHGDPEVAAELRELARYVLADPQQEMAAELGYIPLPERVLEKVRAEVEEIQ